MRLRDENVHSSDGIAVGLGTVETPGNKNIGRLRGTGGMPTMTAMSTT